MSDEAISYHAVPAGWYGREQAAWVEGVLTSARVGMFTFLENDDQVDLAISTLVRRGFAVSPSSENGEAATVTLEVSGLVIDDRASR